MIEIDNLSKHFGSLRALDRLSLNVPRGQLFCFLGPNGAGKTTAIKILCGLLRPSSGTARIAGLDIISQPTAVRRLIGYIPDMPFLYERLTPGEFMEFIGDLHRLPAAHTAAEQRRFFELFDLTDKAQTLIKNLSHGYRQRLIYSAALLPRPQVLFVDEPFVGLDPYSIRLIRNLLREQARAGMTIFLTTHILALAEDLADRIGILSGGRLAGLGTLDELKAISAVQGPLEDIFLRLTGRGS